jgi:hypothetical protein
MVRNKETQYKRKNWSLRFKNMNGLLNIDEWLNWNI